MFWDTLKKHYGILFKDNIKYINLEYTGRDTS